MEKFGFKIKIKTAAYYTKYELPLITILLILSCFCPVRKGGAHLDGTVKVGTDLIGTPSTTNRYNAVQKLQSVNFRTVLIKHKPTSKQSTPTLSKINQYTFVLNLRKIFLTSEKLTFIEIQKLSNIEGSRNLMLANIMISDYYYYYYYLYSY